MKELKKEKITDDCLSELKKDNEEWVDNNGNRWSTLSHTREEALAKSKTLVYCFNCICSDNCKNCIECDYCEDCENCLNCLDCGDNSKNLVDCRSCYRCDTLISCTDCFDLKNAVNNN